MLKYATENRQIYYYYSSGPEHVRVLRMIHIKLNVYHTEVFLPRYWREQFYQQLSAMSSEAIKPAHAGLHDQASTCVCRRDRVRRLESSRK